MTRRMKDSGIEWIGEIPEEWGISKYKRFTTNGMGSTILKEDLIDSGIPVYSATKDSLIFGYLENPKIKLEKDDFIIPARGNSIGYVYMIKDKLATCTQTTIYSKINNDINKKYLLYQSKGLKEYWFEFDNTAIPQITVEQVANNRVLVPSRSEQKAIANFLDKKMIEIDNIISKTKTAMAEYKKYKQSLITETVTRGLDKNVEMKDSGIEWIGEIPEHWEVIRLGFLGRLQNGINKSGEEFGFGNPFVNYGDIYRNYELDNSTFSGLVNSTEKERENYSVKKGDVLFTRTSETKEEIGYAATCLETIENSAFTGFAIRFRPFKKSLLDPKFGKYYFRSEMHRKYFVKEMNIVTRVSLSQELLMKLSVILPPLKEQKTIANYLDNKCSQIDNIISTKEKLLLEMEAYKKSLIYETVTGKREVE